ncbi:MAG TPA: YicC/YloC family endoribonuclease [Burkholderiaceae bacterium]|nr:YicC/YloC family endoribonuclease [Burkholderiaceae bacterium]
MTGFAAVSRPTEMGTLLIEIRSVNSRFLDLGLRIPDELRSLEAVVRETIAARVARGKVDCRVALQRQGDVQQVAIDTEALAALARLASEVQRATGAAPLSTGEILAWEGVLSSPGVDPEHLRHETALALDEALAALQASRGREGAALAAGLLQRCQAVDAIVAEVRARAPELLAALERKLAERLEKALAPALGSGGTLTREEVTDRIRQEVTLYGLRADVEEELNRLTAHVSEVRRILQMGGTIGRRLDFLMQELNREANTLGSKATAIEMTQAAVELKLLIEQMREQIQNLE